MAKLTIPSKIMQASEDHLKNQARKTGFGDKFLEFVPKHEYKVRLISIEDESPTSKFPKGFPFFEIQNHVVQDPTTKRFTSVTCPTTFYGNEGFRKCPICSAIYPFYKSGSATDKKLWDTFRRRFNGYVPVLVEMDTHNPKNDGTVKIMRYGTEIDKYLKQRVFGIVKEQKQADGQPAKQGVKRALVPLRDKAFLVPGQAGRSLIISVGQQQVDGRTFNSYTTEFDTEETIIDIDPVELGKKIDDLNFFEQFHESTEAELRKVVNQYILHIETAETTSVIEPEEVVEVVSHTIAPTITRTAPAATPAPQQAPVQQQAPVEVPSATSAIDDDDLTSLLKELETGSGK